MLKKGRIWGVLDYENICYIIEIWKDYRFGVDRFNFYLDVKKKNLFFS